MEKKTTIDNNIVVESAAKPAPPKNYLIPAIIITVICCSPIGAFGLLSASRVERFYNKGEYEKADKESEKAKKLLIYAIVVWIILVCAYMYFSGMYLSHTLEFN